MSFALHLQPAKKSPLVYHELLLEFQALYKNGKVEYMCSLRFIV